MSATETTTSLEKHLRYSRVLSAQDLADFYEAYDFTVLCTTRLALEEAEMNDEECAAVEEADARFRKAFTPETLARYTDYFPEMPIRTWWG